MMVGIQARTLNNISVPISISASGSFNDPLIKTVFDGCGIDGTKQPVQFYYKVTMDAYFLSNVEVYNGDFMLDCPINIQELLGGATDFITNGGKDIIGRLPDNMKDSLENLGQVANDAAKDINREVEDRTGSSIGDTVNNIFGGVF